MCLSRITESYEPPCPMITDGWKSLGTDPKKPRLQMKLNGKLEIPFDTWLKATDENVTSGLVRADDGNNYKPGFHAYSDESELNSVKRRYSGDYRRVFLRGISCSGTQDGWKVVVAQEMYIPSDPDGWPPKGNEPVSGDGGPGGKRPNPIKKMIDKTIADMKGMGVTPGQA